MPGGVAGAQPCAAPYADQCVACLTQPYFLNTGAASSERSQAANWRVSESASWRTAMFISRQMTYSGAISTTSPMPGLLAAQSAQVIQTSAPDCVSSALRAVPLLGAYRMMFFRMPATVSISLDNN